MKSLYAAISLPKQILPRHLLGNSIREFMQWVWQCQGRGSLLGCGCDLTVCLLEPPAHVDGNQALLLRRVGIDPWEVWEEVVRMVWFSQCLGVYHRHPLWRRQGCLLHYVSQHHTAFQCPTRTFRSRSKSLLHINKSNLYILLLYLMYVEFSRIATTK